MGLTKTQRLRTQRRWNVTDEEIANLKAGKCWCGVPKSDFDKGRRVYCSVKHANEWHERTIYWSNLREEFLIEHGSYCDECGINEEKLEKINTQNRTDFYKTIKRKYPEAIEKERVEMLDQIEKDYENAMNDDYIIEHMTNWVLEKHGIEMQEPRTKYLELEVDHRIAIVNGGDPFDKANLQVLCKKCHIDKTKQDMTTLRESSIVEDESLS